MANAPCTANARAQPLCFRAEDSTAVGFLCPSLLMPSLSDPCRPLLGFLDMLSELYLPPMMMSLD